MAINTEKKVSRIKSKKKSWYALIAPPLFGGKEIGETYRTSPEEALGTVLEMNLRELTGDLKDQHAALHFKITRAEGSKLFTEVIGYELTPASVKRLVRKNTSRLDDCFFFQTKDGKPLVVKTLLITLSKTQHSIQAHLRRVTQDFLRKEISAQDFNGLVESLLRRKLPLEFKKILNKVYPLKEAVFRVIQVQGEEQAARRKRGAKIGPETSSAAAVSLLGEPASPDKPDEGAAALEESSDGVASSLIEEGEEAAAEA